MRTTVAKALCSQQVGHVERFGWVDRFYRSVCVDFKVRKVCGRNDLWTVCGICLHALGVLANRLYLLAIAVPQRRVTSLGIETMSSLRFYYDLMSQPSRALFIIFRLSGMQFEDCVVALRNGKLVLGDKGVNLIDNIII